MSILAPPKSSAQQRAPIPESSLPDQALHRRPVLPPRRRYRPPLAPQPVQPKRTVVYEKAQPETWDPTLHATQEPGAEFTVEAPLAAVRAEVQAAWHGKIGERKPVLESRRIVQSLAVALIATILVFGIARFYAGVQQRANSGNVMDAQLAAAEAALKENDLAAALVRFEQILDVNPGDKVAQRGYAEAWRRMQLAKTYDTAIATLDAGQYEQALAILSEIDRTAPNYRDVRQRIQQVENTLQVRQLYLDAESAYTAQQWEMALQGYEALRAIDGVYAAEVVVPHLAEVYRRLGQQIVGRRPDKEADLTRARSYFDRALRLQPGEAVALQEADLLARYNAAAIAQDAGDLAGMVASLAPLYAERPAYLGGYAAKQLYAAYLQLGDEAAATGDITQAMVWYDEAAALQSLDISEAARRREALSAAPTVEVTPEPVVQAPVYVQPVVELPPTPAPPTPSGLESYHGWIAFRTSRDGEAAVYLMQPDGSQQQRAPEDALAKLDQLYGQQQWSIDGAQVYVANAPNRDDTNIYVVQRGSPEASGDMRMLTDFPGLEYDPAWSPDGKSIAFVANHTLNDEIFTLAVGGAPVQLTHNEWEWDKHPSWSPDGSQIVFYSNRSGQRQIWLMNADGSNQRNVSNSSAEDWDPVWIR